ncbi:MAG: hypothetical protein ACK5WZ_13095, partial [Pseudobdellovibrionaceae bacterium]
MVGVFRSALLLILMTNFLNAQAPVVTSQKIVLTQRGAAELALQNGTRAKETIYKYDGLEADKADFNLPLYLSNYDWKTTLESGYELDKLETFTITDTKFQRYRSQLSLDKSFLTGTQVTSSYLRLSQKAEYPIGSENFSKTPIERTQDLFSLTVEQNLWRNAFGRADRAELRAIEYASDSNQILKVSELQVVVLDAIRAFWKAYVA